MNARERLAATLAKACETESVGGVGLVRRHDDHPTRCLRDHDGFAAALLATDDTLAADIEDGAALRRLREAVGKGGQVYVGTVSHETDEWEVLCLPLAASVHERGTGPTIAAAADACREAIEADR